jgi:predicted DNA-binding antitoxin AbrB/MazE fold protein
MSQIVEALYDGAVLRPESALTLEPNIRVRLTVEVLPSDTATPSSFLETARSLNLSGPPDWSANLGSPQTRNDPLWHSNATR